MLGRRILRIKVFKTLYSYAENQGMSLKEAEVQMRQSQDSTRDLYLFMLSVIGPLTAEAAARIEAARCKFNPTEEERNPNLKFVQNRLAPLFADDPDFTKIIKKKKITWEPYDALLRKLYEDIRDKDWFQKYLDSGEGSLAEDARLWIKIFENEFEDNADLAAILEDLSIYWNDDLGYALTWCCKTLTGLAEGKRWELPPLYMSQINASDSSDSDFANKLLTQAFAGYGRYCDMVAGNTPRWEMGRICTTDLCLIVCGLAEAEAFPSTPINIIINEYVELSKSYSTPDSRSFVNGLLDKLINKR